MTDKQAETAIDTEKTLARIAAARRTLGARAVVLAHHYQRDEIVELADFTGDSLKLARIAAEQTAAEYIIFCGVHFMAESADILTDADRKVLLPELTAGCPMADMATGAQVDAALAELSARVDGRIVPITYVNSTAEVKAVTGRYDGSCCTSGNAASVVTWAFESGADKIFAAPDQHLIRATALDMGYALDDCVVYDPRLPGGGVDDAALAAATFVLWAGECTVHQVFRVVDVRARREEMPGVTVIVHPECEIAVVQAADLHGSTGRIIEAVESSRPGSSWAVGTEDSLVARLASRFPDRQIVNLSPWRLTCLNMQKIKLASLAAALEDAVAGRLAKRITVPEPVRRDALKALERMINL